MEKRILLSGLAFMVFSFAGFGQHCVDFNSLNPGDQYGDGINAVGEVIFTESDIPVSVEYFEWNTGGTFGTATVNNPSGFGSGNVMWTSNINLRFDFTQLSYPVTKVTFIYADYGGFENFSVNGHPIYVGELENIPAFPDVSISHAGTANGGMVTIYGPVDELIVGGQEFELDDICTFEVGSDCVDFESQTLGKEYGDGFNAVGEVVFAESGIPVAVEYFYWNTGGTFGVCEIYNAMPDFGDGQIMGMNNINLKFDFTQLGFQVSEVTFEYADQGGHENFSVNGGPVYVGELTAAPSPPGITMSVTTTSFSGGEKGLVSLMGPVDTLLVGGQEFRLDNICVYFMVDMEENPEAAASGVQLGQNYPNPVVSETLIPFRMKEPQKVTLEIFNNMGQKVRTLFEGLSPSGAHEILWNGKDQHGNPVPAGIYLYSLKTRNFSRIRKMIVLD